MARLILHSDQILPQSAKMDQQLPDLTGKPNPSVGYIPSEGASGMEFFRERQAYYAELGFELSVYFELDNQYHPEILPSLLECDAIHLSGGNTYRFLHRLQERGMLQPLRDFVQRGGVLIGVSAGAILLTPDISTAALTGDVLEDPQMDLTALRMVDFAFVPHVDIIRGGLEAAKQFSRSHHLPVFACRDGDGIIVRDDELIRSGDVILIQGGEVAEIGDA